MYPYLMAIFIPSNNEFLVTFKIWMAWVDVDLLNLNLAFYILNASSSEIINFLQNYFKNLDLQIGKYRQSSVKKTSWKTSSKTTLRFHVSTPQQCK